MSHSNLVLGYHGCDITVRDELVAGLTQLRSSNNPYDWLGTGIYLYEADPERAFEHASTVCQHPERLLAASAIATPAVVGVVLDVSRWLDMSTRSALQEFAIAAETCREGSTAKGGRPLENGPAFEGDTDNLHRVFDKASFDLLHGLRELERKAALARDEFYVAAELRPYQAVRSAFSQGLQIAEHSQFCTKNHTQIAVRDPACIRGYFIPAGFPSMQPPAERAVALERLAQAKSMRTKAKPRKRA